MTTNPPPLQYGVTYHVYNRGVNRESVFHGADNYRYFLDLYTMHVGWLVDTYAYCLLGNHFHFLLRVKDEAVVDELRQHLTGAAENAGSLRPHLPGVRRVGMVRPINYYQPPSQHFANLFNAYVRSFNTCYGRTGALFQRPFGRIPVTTDEYFAYLVVYIHQNPRKHGFVEDYRNWPYSSYHALCSDRPTRLNRVQVLAWLGGRSGFEFAHHEALWGREDASGL